MNSDNPTIKRLRRLCEKRLPVSYSENLQEKAQRRLERELALIQGWDDPERFIAASEIANFALANDIPFRLLGASCCSVVAYCLGISVVDPLIHSLPSERFIGPSMSGPLAFQFEIFPDERAEIEEFGRRLIEELERYGLTVDLLPYAPEDREIGGVPSAVGCHINFLHVGNLILLPVFGRHEDAQVHQTLKRLCPDAEIRTVQCTKLARLGGVLRCCSWTVQA